MSEDLATIPAAKKSNTGKKVLIALLVIIALAVLIKAISNSSAAEIASPTTQGNLTSIPAATVPPSDPNTDKSFHLESVSFRDLASMASANARLTNISNSVKTAMFGISIFEPDGVTVAVNLIGSAEDVQPGQTVTVEFVGAQSLPDGQFQYAFQVSSEY